jgi:sporulation protein YlmC with PRC-barrel domain
LLNLIIVRQICLQVNLTTHPLRYNEGMYARASKLENLPVISLQSGEAVAWIKQPVINISTFEILAFECDSTNHNRPVILLTNDIRQLAADCVIVDSDDELAEPDDIIRLTAIIKADYTPLDKPVISDLGRKLGSVEDYTINLDTSRIQKLYVRQSLFRAWLGSSLTIDHSQIVEVTPQRIIVRDVTIRAPAIHPEPMPEINT